MLTSVNSTSIQVFLNRLLVLEGLAVATNLPPGKVVFGMWEPFELLSSSDETSTIIAMQGRKLGENGKQVDRARVSEVQELPKSDGGSRSDYDTQKQGTVSGPVVEKTLKSSSEPKLVDQGESKREKLVSAPHKDLPLQGQALLTNLTINGEVWIVPGVWRHLQLQLQHDLSALSLSNATTVDGKSLSKGEMVLALWEDNNWHRGRVVNLLENNLLEIFFVDWGNTELMKREEVVRMESVPGCEKLEAIKDLAVRGFLHKVLV